MERPKKTTPIAVPQQFLDEPQNFTGKAIEEQLEHDWTADRPKAYGAGYPRRVVAGDNRSTLGDRRFLAKALAEQAARRKEALKLYEPYPEQEEFHASPAGLRLARGGNRSGKTVATAVELARAITGQDPYHKYPAKGRVIVVGRDLLHISKVVWRKVFEPGAFKIVRDPKTKHWRAYRPDQDQKLKDKAVDAPPLVPRRFYSEKMVSWENKREVIPRTVRTHTGWELTFFSGEGAPPQGWDVDLILFDEEIPHVDWVKEMKARLVDRQGKFIWSATPQAGTVALYDLSARAERERGEANPRVTEHLMTIAKNPFISEQAKDDFRSDYADDDDEYQVRVEGEFALAGMKVYPEFSKRGVHKVEVFPVPSEWTRYVAIDPGRQVAAALFIAVPPPHATLDRPVVYDEVYLRKANAQLFAQEVKRKVAEHWLSVWLIDHHEGRKVETASGRSIEEQYAEAFRAVGLEANGFTGFYWASDDVKAGIMAVQGKLHIHEGKPGWYFMVDKLPGFCYEIERYANRRMHRESLIVDLNVRSKLHDHLMDCMRYLAMYPLKYLEPPKKRVSLKEEAWTHKYLQAKKKRQFRESGWGTSIRLG